MRAALAVATLGLAACAGPPALGTTASELVTTSPLSVDFGAVEVGSTAIPRAVTVLPSGTLASSDTIASISESCGDVSLDLSTLENPPVVERVCDGSPPFYSPPGPCENHVQVFHVGFAPTVVGPQACDVVISMDSGQERIVTVTGTGTAPPVQLTVVSPADRMIDFGDVVVSRSSSPVPIVLRGDGTEPATYTVSATPATISLSGELTGGLSDGEQATVFVGCNPTAPGPIVGMVQIASNDPDEGMITIPVTCSGITSSLVFSSSPLYFLPTLTGGVSSRQVGLMNTSGAALDIASITLDPPELFEITTAVPTGIGAGAIQNLAIEFHPDAAVVDTDVAGTMTVTFGPPAGQVRTMSLIGPVRRAELSITPGGDLDLGTVCGSDVGRLTATVTNLGTGAGELTGAHVTGDGFDLDFQAGLPFSLEPAASNELALVVSASPGPGEVTGTLVLDTSIPGARQLVRNLRAVGVASGLGADPAELAFDGTPVGGASGVRTVRLTNCDDGPVTITTAGISGPDAAEFFLVADDLPDDGVLAVGATATWLVELRPATGGTKTASLDLLHGIVTSIPLSGVGDGPVEGGRGSYYACAAADPGTAWPLGLALIPLVRRRRRATSA